MLEELPASQVGAAVERLLRESSSTTLPPPGALRARALEVPEPPDPAPPATPRGSPVAPFNGMALAALLAGQPASWRTIIPAGPYAGMNITGVTGISAAQKAALRALGAVEESQ